ncbi:MAG: LCP family protein [Oscillospiraceae bacterium]|nr:LCP family protein [Oscillospiraceae bacterium]
MGKRVKPRTSDVPREAQILPETPAQILPEAPEPAMAPAPEPQPEEASAAETSDGPEGAPAPEASGGSEGAPVPEAFGGLEGAPAPETSDGPEADPARRAGQRTWRLRLRWLIPGGVALAGLVLMGCLYLANSVITPPARIQMEPEPLPQDPVYEGVTPAPTPTPDGTVTPSPATPEGRREGVYTIILAGTDMDDYHTDVLMVAALDTVNGKLDVLAIPRDTQVAVRRASKKINAAWGVGMNVRSGDKSERVAGAIGQLRAELKTVIGFVPDAYAVVDLKGFVRLVDAMGGVEFDVPQDMYYSDASQDLYVNLKKGRQVLNGDKAIQLVRFRSTYVEGDMKRVEVQQAFLTEAFKQLLTVKHIFKLPEFAAIAQENLRTDLSLGQMVWFGQELLKLEEDSITFYTLPGDATASYLGTSYLLVDRDAALALINETINPFTKDITAENVNISRLRGSRSQ